MSEMAACLGVPPLFAFEGREYKVAARDFEIEASVELLLEGRALEKVQRHREKFSPQEYQLQLDGWRRDCTVGTYSWGSPECVRWWASQKGMQEFAVLVLKRLNREVDAEVGERIWADEPPVNDQGKPTRVPAWEEFQLKMQEANQDPNLKRAQREMRPA